MSKIKLPEAVRQKFVDAGRAGGKSVTGAKKIAAGKAGAKARWNGHSKKDKK